MSSSKEKWKNKYDELKTEFKDFRAAMSYELQQKKHRHRTQIRLSKSQGYKMAIKRNVAHGSQMALLSSIEVGVTRQTVSEWEMRLGNNLHFQSRLFHEEQYRYMRLVKESWAKFVLSSITVVFQFKLSRICFLN